MKSVLQDWVMELPLRAQGALLTGMRGCDLAPKVPGIDAPERRLVAFLRWCILHPADQREVDVPSAWFQTRPPENWKPSLFDQYPTHWYTHLMHSYEIVGYCCSDPKKSIQARHVYFKMVRALHLIPETKAEMLERLTEDRIAADTVVS